MRRYHLRRALDRARLSWFERNSSTTGLLSIVVGAGMAFVTADPAGPARALGSAGLLALAMCAISRAARLMRAGNPASLPESVGRMRVRIRPSRVFNAGAVGVALVVPVAAVVVVLALVAWAWLLIALVLLLDWAGVVTSWARASADQPYAASDEPASALLERLCMRADMPVPKLVVEPGAVANAWTAGGRIHVTSSLLNLLEQHELEAVLAHEVAHLARRDSAVMEICSSPSCMLLSYVRFVVRRLPKWTRELVTNRFGILALITAVLCIPPAFLLGWISRLSLLSLSRAREFSADVAAAALIGRPSALASALLKLEQQRDWTPLEDLREVEPFAMLCIVGTARARLGRLLSTHPPTAERVKRLEELEASLHGTAQLLLEEA